jgi:hypothetical protein
MKITPRSRPNRSLATVTLLMAIPLITGCAVLIGPGKPPIEGSLIKGKRRSALIERLTGESRLPATIKALTRATIKQKDSTESFKYSLVYANPSSIRFDLYPLNPGFTLQRLTAKDGSATLIDMTTNESFSGETKETFSKSFLQLAATEQEVAALLLGRVPQPYLADTSTAIYEGSTEVAVVSSGGDLTWRMNAKNLQMQELAVKELIVKERITGRLVATAKYSEPVPCGSMQLPGRVEVTIAADDSSLVFINNKPDCNSPIRADIFDLRVPKRLSEK